MPIDSGQLLEWERQIARGEALVGASPRRDGLRIVVLGWARLSRQAGEGSGLNLSASELAAELVRRGNRVMYLRSGMEYSVRPGMRFSFTEVWRGVGCFSLVNSPNLAPGNFNFRNIATQTSHAKQAELVVEWVRAVRADIVHVQALEGFSLDTIEALRMCGIPVVVTPHNYYYLCPQIDLLANERTVCEDYEGGARCVDCLHHAPDPAADMAWRKRYQSAERLMGPDAWSQIKYRGRELSERLTALAGSTKQEVPILGGAVPPPPHPTSLPARPVDVHERLLNAPGKLHACNDYGRRRLASIAALNAASRIMCPSRFLMKLHASFGVHEASLVHVPLGQPHFDLLRAAAVDSPFADAPAWRPTDQRPLRLAYFGNCYPNKGLATLCEAVERMPTELARRVHLVVRAAGDHGPFRRWMEGRLNVSFLGGYDLGQLLSAPNEYDAVVFPNMGLENSPFVVLESLHAGRSVIASDLGGPTDFVQHRSNGLLFRAGDADALVRAIADVVSGEFALPSIREVHERSQLVNFAAYANAAEEIFRGVHDAQ
ncbi:MAG: glycosyltransferase [Planctomycetota bacterium]|nr:glycosyltransferase [Planctomycetota bacterium]